MIRNLLIICVFLLAILLEYRAILQLAPNGMLRDFLLYHLVATTVFCVGLYLMVNRPRNLLVFSILLWSLMPGIGIFAFFTLLVLLPRLESPDLKALEVDELMEEEESILAELSAARLVISGEQDGSYSPSEGAGMKPYVDIIKHGTREEQRDAIYKLRKIKTRESISILRLGQKNERYEIRYLATISLNIIEQEWNARIRLLVDEIETQPQSVESRNELVFLAMRLHRSTIVPASIGRIYLKKALNNAIISLQLKADQPSLRIEVGKISLFMGNYDQALRMFDKVVEDYPGVPEYRFWRVEALF